MIDSEVKWRKSDQEKGIVDVRQDPDMLCFQAEKEEIQIRYWADTRRRPNVSKLDILIYGGAGLWGAESELH